MTKDALLALAKPLWAEDIRRRAQVHAHAMQQIAAECASKGIGYSGAHISIALDACVSELRFRAELARGVLLKTITTTGTRWDDRDLRSLYLDLIVNMYKDVRDGFESLLHGLAPVVGANHNALMLSHSHEEVAAIDKELAELTLAAAAPQSPEGGGASVVIHGSVYGAVQTGAGSTADVTVNIDSGNALALREAVAALRESIRVAPPPDLPAYADAVFADLETEASQPAPRAKRIVALLEASAAVIETLASAPGAWETVRHAALAIGVTLP